MISTLLTLNVQASYSYYEEPEDDFELTESETAEESTSNQDNTEIITRLADENQKIQELSQNIDVKLPLDLELEQSLGQNEDENEIDTTAVKQSAINREPAIKDEDQTDLNSTEVPPTFNPEESDEVSLSNSAILKTASDDTQPEYRTRKLRSR